jgi:hypothetical protein
VRFNDCCPIPEAVQIGQLLENHHQQLIPAGKVAIALVAIILQEKAIELGYCP